MATTNGSVDMAAQLAGIDDRLTKGLQLLQTLVSASGGLNLINDALSVPMPKEERDALIAALTRLGKTSARARWLAAVHEGLTSVGEGSVDVGAWSKGGGEYRAPPMASAKFQGPNTRKPAQTAAKATFSLRVHVPILLEIFSATVSRCTPNGFIRVSGGPGVFHGTQL